MNASGYVKVVLPASVFALTLRIIGGARQLRGANAPALQQAYLFGGDLFAADLLAGLDLFQLLSGSGNSLAAVSGHIDPVIGTTLERTTNIYTINSLISGNWLALASTLAHLVLPTLTLGLILSGVFVRLTRINVIETLHADYIFAARACGIVNVCWFIGMLLRMP